MISKAGIERAGVLGLFVFAGSGLAKPSLAIVGFLLMTFASCWRYCGRSRRAFRHPFFVASISFSVYALLIGFLAYLNAPDRLEAIAKWTTVYIAVSGVPALIVATWLDGNNKTINWTLSIALLALLIAILNYCEYDQIKGYLAGNRAFFHLGNGAGLYIITGIIGILTISLARLKRHQHVIKWSHGIITSYYVIAFCILSLAFIWHQNRSAWISGALVVPSILIMFFRTCFSDTSREKKQYWPNFLMILMIIFLAALYVGGAEITQRFVKVNEVVELALENDIDDLPNSATADRLKLWKIGITSVTEHPFFGKGPGSVSQLVSHDKKLARYTHLHNLYLHLVVETGVFGLLLYSFVLIAMFRSALNSYISGKMPCEIFYFIIGIFALFVLVNLTQVRIDDSHGMFYTILMGAIAITYDVTYMESRS